jgi:hypothetical protein
MTLRTGDQVHAMLAGFDLVPPGLVQLPEWRPDDPHDVGECPQRYSTYSAVGRLG